MQYNIPIYRRAFEAIQSGKKKFEVRTLKSYEDIDYSQVCIGDVFSFQIVAGPPFRNLDVISDEVLEAEVTWVYHFHSAMELFLVLGFDWLSFQPSSLEEAIEGLHQIKEYKENIPEYGVYVYELKV